MKIQRRGRNGRVTALDTDQYVLIVLEDGSEFQIHESYGALHVMTHGQEDRGIEVSPVNGSEIKIEAVR